MHLECKSHLGRYLARIFVTGKRTAKAEVVCVRNNRTETRRFRRHTWREAEAHAIDWAKAKMARMEGIE